MSSRVVDMSFNCSCFKYNCLSNFNIGLPFGIFDFLEYSILPRFHCVKILEIVEYLLSNIEFIDLPKLFSEVGKIYPPEIINIELDKEFNLDISQKSLLDKPNTLLPRLSYIGNIVRSSSHHFRNMNTNKKNNDKL